MEEIRCLFRFSGGDFEVWESNEHKVPYYNISIEGYIGYEKLESFVILYQKFLEHFHKFLLENKYEKTERYGWKKIYRTRAMEICQESKIYLVFLDGYKSIYIWDLYYYMEDVIEQLKEIMKKVDGMEKDGGNFIVDVCNGKRKTSGGYVWK